MQPPGHRPLLAAAIIAAIIGFAAGWIARQYHDPSVETRANRAAGTIRERIHDLSR